jgi:hypothetical protein
MGIDLAEMARVLEALPHYPGKPCKVLDIGTQNLGPVKAGDLIRFIRHYNDPWDLDDLANYAEIVSAGSANHPRWGGINGAWLGDVLTRAGMDYTAYDIFEGYRTTIFDLNSQDLPIRHLNAFDLVLNCGTSEHVLNQYNVFKVMHQAVRVGGLMYHAVPMTGYLTHGYFTYTPMLFCDLAQANDYQIVEMNLVGPQAQRQVSENLVQRYGGVVHFGPTHPTRARWDGVSIPDSLVSVILRRTSDVPFRASLEVTTAAAPVANSVQRNYRQGDGFERPDGGDDTSAKREKVDQWIKSILHRLDDPDLDYLEVVDLHNAHQEAYAGAPFPALIELRALDLAILAHPDREDLVQQRANVEARWDEQWPLLRLTEAASPIEPEEVALDGQEAALLAISNRYSRFCHAVGAFQHYFAARCPERYPAMLEFDALRYAAEELYPDDWPLRQILGRRAAKLSTSITLGQRR